MSYIRILDKEDTKKNKKNKKYEELWNDIKKYIDIEIDKINNQIKNLGIIDTEKTKLKKNLNNYNNILKFPKNDSRYRYYFYDYKLKSKNALEKIYEMEENKNILIWKEKFELLENEDECPSYDDIYNKILYDKEKDLYILEENNDNKYIFSLDPMTIFLNFKYGEDKEYVIYYKEEKLFNSTNFKDVLIIYKELVKYN